jgi:hypothetical protein
MPDVRVTGSARGQRPKHKHQQHRPEARGHQIITGDHQHMSDTLELLERIGANASLRHASADELAAILATMEASDALKAAAQTGDGSLLRTELGHKPMKVNHDVHDPGHEEPDHDEDDPRRKKLPPAPHHPDHDEPSRDR